MASAYERKKQPEVVRQKLLDCAARMAAERGLANLTLQEVASAAGVTKGGLLHHFPNKQKLTEAVCAALVEKLDREIDHHLEKDPVEYGRFTRAYVRAFVLLKPDGRSNPWAALSISTLLDETLSRSWSDWLKARLSRHRDTDAGVSLEIIRYAADGVWFADLSAPDTQPLKERQKLLSRLLAMTQEKDT
ncbi:TetR family transcriptional regulator [Cystobacter fuscus]|uniref:TetR family transcriptional regulator n=1 Tax=Cystobacter fuscus TaxID=43 RepID=A0A250J1V4_9BACT|nr:TetR/AcrR family transcriptional regulator [Cystobacter fuscus]ATB37136.1 TetR family transcriptional regulator [Cystobacter fuscus]